MHAQGMSPADGWSSSPSAAYYASLDSNNPLPKPASSLPTTLAELMQLHKNASEEKNEELADLLQRQCH